MPRLLLALDLDGTLLSDATTVPSGHQLAVAALRQLGVAVAIVTGRPTMMATWVHDLLRLDTPLVGYNGGWVGYPTMAPMAAKVLPEEDVRAAIALVQGLGGALCAYPEGREWIMDREILHTRAWREVYRLEIPVVPERFANWRGPSSKLMYVADPSLVPNLTRALKQRFAGRFEVVASQHDRIEILPRGISKAWGLSRLAAHLGIDQANVWAAGDADNDLEMVAWAGHGCAMGQAPESLKRVARHLLPSIEARGLCALVPMLERALRP